MIHIHKRFKESESFIETLNVLHQGKDVLVTGCEASLKECIIATIVREFQKPILYIVKGPKEQDTAAENCKLFLDRPVYSFPALDFIPGQGVHPQIEITSERLKVLETLLEPQEFLPVVIATSHSISQHVVGRAVLDVSRIEIKPQMSISRDELCKKLVDLGYEPTPMIEKKGDFSVRGGVIDVYSILEDDPYRIEFFGDTIESIRVFDAYTQKSTESIDHIVIVPCKEKECIEEGNATLVEYISELSDKPLIVFDELFELKRNTAQFYDDFKTNSLYIPFDNFYGGVAEYQKVFFNLFEQSSPEFKQVSKVHYNVKRAESLSEKTTVPFSEVSACDSDAAERKMLFEDKQDTVLGEIERLVDKKYKICIVCNNAGEKDRYTEIIDEKGYEKLKKIPIVLGRLHTGFIFPECKIALIADQDIFNRYKVRSIQKKFKGVNPIAELTEIKNGDYVVHINYGIGKYKGLQMIEKDGIMQEFMALEYAEKAYVYVPIENINLVERYIGVGKRPTLDKLGSSRWKQVKKRVQIVTAGIAADLLDVQAAREILEGTPFSKDNSWMREFESAFIYEETTDQMRTIDEVKRDMESRKPMDRLICGDVGYGKTEVAIRAAFKCVMDNRQVAVLVPTTILADQHFRTFCERMQDYPIKIEMLSRFRSKREQANIVNELSAGTVDIVIGTHRLLQKDVAFKNIGLVIVDEEQRFGVRHKEKLKQLRKLIDVLTLTATPIPRTLYMSFLGVKEMSAINTPPENRLPIETYIIEYHETVIRKAIVHELAREGQVFYVHNRVKTINRVKERLQKLVPEARITVAHGQMDEDELAEIMHLFVNGKIDVLVCTTIIESGLDIPNANTIIIERADMFGLSELYQLRGRVGRYNVRAYAYLLFPPNALLLSAAKKRLRALTEFSGMGSGFKLAMKDLEIRGAGNILGKEQHGYITAVGFDLYCRLLKQNIVRQRGDSAGMSEKEVVLKLGMRPYLPLSYIGDESIRINLYKRIASCEKVAEINEIHAELNDRFGPLPKEVALFMDTSMLKIIARSKNIHYIEVKQGKCVIKRNNEVVLFNGHHARITATRQEGIVEEVLKIVNTIT